MPSTMFDKLWARHTVAELPGGTTMLHVSRHYLHDLLAGPVLAELEASGRTVFAPELTFATADHAVATRPSRPHPPGSPGGQLLQGMRDRTAKAGIRLFDLGKDGQGIVNVIGPELALTLPGALVVCNDSHTCTQGGLGALAFHIGPSEALHVLATQTIRQTKPKTMRLAFKGDLPPWLTAKDIILFAIGRYGTSAARGYAVEFAGSTVRQMDVEARLTLCNMAIELGARIGMVAPDEITFDYLAGRPFAPQGTLFDRAMASWRRLPSDAAAVFDSDLSIHTSIIAPQITWGTSPKDVIGIDGRVPDPVTGVDAAHRAALARSADYMGFTPGQAIDGTPIDVVFIGSCTNGRLSDLRQAAQIADGRRVAPGVTALVVPGSRAVKQAAEAEGLDRIFQQAGFEWRDPGCSLCLSANGEVVAPGQRCVSTSSRNFAGRQGPGARTHLASPAMAAAAAVMGTITDVRRLQA